MLHIKLLVLAEFIFCPVRVSPLFLFCPLRPLPFLFLRQLFPLAMQSFSAMRQALVSLALRGPKAAPKKSGGGKAKDTGALKKKKVVKKAVVSKESSKTAQPTIHYIFPKVA